MSQTFANGCAYIAGEYVPLEQAAMPLTDWGFLRGDCVYDAIPFSGGRLFRLNDHIDRFWVSMDKWRLSSPLSKDEVHAICHSCVSKAQLRDGLLLIITTRGTPPSLEIRNPALFKNRFYAMAQILPPIATPENMKKGLRVVVSSVPRVPQESIDSTAKNFQWGDLMQARLEAHDADVDNAVLLDFDGNLTEGPGFNVFIVKGNIVSTPAKHCLKGITRDTVMQIAADRGYEVQERDIPVNELLAADEAMFSTSAGGVMPVTEVDGKSVGSGERGPATTAIVEEYWKRRADPAFSEAVDYG